jgi:hypothetical protein
VMKSRSLARKRQSRYTHSARPSASKPGPRLALDAGTRTVDQDIRDYCNGAATACWSMWGRRPRLRRVSRPASSPTPGRRTFSSSRRISWSMACRPTQGATRLECWAFRLHRMAANHGRSRLFRRLLARCPTVLRFPAFRRRCRAAGQAQRLNLRARLVGKIVGGEALH